MDLFLQIFTTFFSFLMHIDMHLFELTEKYGLYIYIILFIIIFCETGLVVTPFLPGDSLLFAAGTLAGAGLLSYPPLVATILTAAIIGDAVNYSIGNYIGPPVMQRNYRFLNKKHLFAAQNFYERHGGKAIILARFIPLIRTFAPFVAGVASMSRKRFLLFNITGALLWVFSLVTCGYLLGNTPFVKKNFSLLIYAIILVSITPIIIGFVKSKLNKNKTQS